MGELEVFWKMPIAITIIVLAIFIKCFFGVISGIEEGYWTQRYPPKSYNVVSPLQFIYLFIYLFIYEPL